MRIIHLLPAMLGAGLLFAAPAHAQAARNYDCSKAGNANKAVCKNAVSATAAKAAAPSPMTSTARHYDCTKAGNARKAVCKGVATTTTTTAAPVSPAAPAPATRTVPVARATSATRSVSTHTVSTSTTTNAAGPNGATAICNDGTYSHSAHHSGTCSGHKGVKQFY